jgi:hydroxypyruvate isomerase
MPFVLAACAEMLYLDLPLVDRVRRIHDLGFAVEIWDWTTRDLPELAATGATFTSMTGYVEGSLTDSDGADALLESAARCVAASRTLTGPMWLAAVETLGRIAELGRREAVVFCLENLNTAVDHPGTPFARAADTAALVHAVGSPHLRMNLDLYHAQIGEGNLIQLVRDSASLLGEVQVADVPGRREPGTGEIRYEAIARALDETGYDGVVGLEAWASGDSTAALEAFRAAFTLGG